MKINRIGDLFSLARGGEGTQNQAQASQVQAQGSQQNAEAIKLAKDFGSGANAAQEANQQKRIEELKKKVADGSYDPGSPAIARALAQDLFA